MLNYSQILADQRWQGGTLLSLKTFFEPYKFMKEDWH